MLKKLENFHKMQTSARYFKQPVNILIISLTSTGCGKQKSHKIKKALGTRSYSDLILKLLNCLVVKRLECLLIEELFCRKSVKR